VTLALSTYVLLVSAASVNTQVTVKNLNSYIENPDSVVKMPNTSVVHS